MSKRTQGPWHAVPRGNGVFDVVGEKRFVAIDVRKDDLALVTTAPDLLAALQFIANMTADGATACDCQIRDLARAAIAKAEGKSE